MASTTAAIDEAILKLDALIIALGGAAELETAKAATLTSDAAPAAPPAAPPVAAQTMAAPPAPANAQNAAPAAAAKPAKQKASKPAPPAAAVAPGDLFSMAKLVVGRVLEAAPVDNSEKLLKCRIDVGGGEVRQVVAGLQQFVAAEALAGACCVVITNLKPAKLAGQASEAMILAADATVGEVLVVKTLVPPAGSEAGDAVYLEGGGPGSAQPKVLKSDEWKRIVAGLSVAAGRPTFEGSAFCTARGPVTLPVEIPDGSGIH